MNLEQTFGVIAIISGPSGVGKTTIYNTLRAFRQKLQFSVSCTTRARRGDEVDGMAYHFIDDETFEKHIQNHDFLECANVHGFYYGTLKSELNYIKDGENVLLDIDVQGMRRAKEELKSSPFFLNRLVTVFIMPPSMQELERRLRGRKTDSEEAIQRRLANAKGEMEHWRDYDYILVNDDSSQSAEALAKIIDAAHFRTQAIARESWL